MYIKHAVESFKLLCHIHALFSTPHRNVWGNKMGRISKTKTKIKNPIVSFSSWVTSYVYV